MLQNFLLRFEIAQSCVDFKGGHKIIDVLNRVHQESHSAKGGFFYFSETIKLSSISILGHYESTHIPTIHLTPQIPEQTPEMMVLFLF